MLVLFDLPTWCDILVIFKYIVLESSHLSVSVPCIFTSCECMDRLFDNTSLPWSIKGHYVYKFDNIILFDYKM